VTTLRRALGVRDATLLVISAVIGVGIFFAPADVARALPHPGLMICAWVFGFALSLAGALANAELSASYPQAGGDYVYLREAYHPIAGFLVGVLSFVAVFAGTIATLSVGLAGAIGGRYNLSHGTTTAIGVAIVLTASLGSAQGVRASAFVANATTYLKVIAMAAICVLGPLLGRGHAENLTPLVPHAASEWSGFLHAMPSILFSYLGWNVSIYVAGEVERPERTIPRSLLLGLLVCGAAYVAMTCTYLYAAPASELANGKKSPIDLVGDALFGSWGGTLVFMLVTVSVIGCINANVLAGPRILYAMAKDGLFFRSALHVHARTRVPTPAIWIQAAISCGLVIVLGTFPKVLRHTTFAIVIATIADIGALYMLRRKNPDRERPYKTWGYPWLPVVYVLANAAIGASMIRDSWKECGLALLELVLAVPVFFVFRRINANMPLPPKEE
jgi:APA family basic amino acid/polyamine antiporter